MKLYCLHLMGDLWSFTESLASFSRSSFIFLQQKSTMNIPNSRTITNGVDIRLHFNEISGDLEGFLRDNKPSKTRFPAYHWIQIAAMIGREGDDRKEARKEARKSHFFDKTPFDDVLNELLKIGRTTKLQKDNAINSILDLAKSQGYTTGKWMLNIPNGEINSVWAKVAREKYEGSLGCSAKVATVADGESRNGQVGSTLIVVYVADFSKLVDVKRVLRRLKKMDLHVAWGFKPDVFTELGINAQNQWNLPCTLYTDIRKEIMDPQKSSTLKRPLIPPENPEPKRHHTEENVEYDAEIARLVEMGFSTDVARSALVLFDGNMRDTLEHLL